MGFKVFVPILAVYVAWPVVGLPAVVAVAPFLLGCAAQFAFEMHLDKCGSSCWPILPIIFEVYNLHIYLNHVWYKILRPNSFNFAGI